MLEEWRTLLYYPLGVLPSVFFVARIFLQWIQSEQKKRSYVSASFWKLSLVGNSLQILHYLVQVQFPFALFQAGNAFISWRNLNLMKKNSCSFRTSLSILSFLLFAVTGVFLAQSHYIIGEIDWVRTPTKLWDSSRVHHHLYWHLFGAFGGALFASRFWLQWWNAEETKKSELNPLFWWLSIAGSIVSLIYFVHIQDVVGVINYSFPLIPYARNLLLLRRQPT